MSEIVLAARISDELPNYAFELIMLSFKNLLGQGHSISNWSLLQCVTK